MIFSINLPLPPSTNRLWRHMVAKGGQARVYKSREYIEWTRVADRYLLAGREPGWAQAMIVGPFDCEIVLDRKKLRGGDPDNRVKALLDWLQSRGIVKNDKHVRELKVTVGECELGCRITVTSV